mmetsp:Transcript_93291/g.204170  ORF Transcript_93291/g.204170 Transcript_93291/m.204170 type:complete len:210 (+) Transcript_93291:705-1334(+)
MLLSELLPRVVLVPLLLLCLLVQDFLLLVEVRALFPASFQLFRHELFEVVSSTDALGLIQNVGEVLLKFQGSSFLGFFLPHWLHLFLALLVQHASLRELLEGRLHLLLLLRSHESLLPPLLLQRLLPTLPFFLFFSEALGLKPLFDVVQAPFHDLQLLRSLLGLRLQLQSPLKIFLRILPSLKCHIGDTTSKESLRVQRTWYLVLRNAC